MSNTLSNTVPAPSADLHSPATITPTNLKHEPSALSEQGHCLLAAIWRSSDKCHQIGTLDRSSNRFTNIPVRDVAEAVKRAYALSGQGIETYHGCSEYEAPANRTAANASGASALWLDVDVGDAKATSGRGYATTEEAKAAISKFCNEAGLPEPTHIVASGGGLHVYWVLDAFVTREMWQECAKKIKALTHALGLHADDTRTADIASVLRIPGTKNYKYAPPRDVVLIHANDQYIERGVMLSAIESAHARYCGGRVELLAGVSSTPSAPTCPVTVNDVEIEPPNLLQLASALKSLDPDCDEKTWKFHRIAPMAYAARYLSEVSDRLYQMTRDWSSGDLRGVPSKKWNTSGDSGFSGKQLFDRVWRRFLTDNYTGKRVSLGTIYFHAKEEGWFYTHDQTQGEDGGGEGEE